MFVAGTAPTRARLLLDVTYEALMRGVAAAKPGATLGDVGHAIQSVVERNRFSVVRDFCGHGIGRRFHEPPNVLHFGRPGEGPVLRPGMFFTVEPMVNAGRADVKILEDGWTAVTRDRSLSAQFEHMVGHHRGRGGGVHRLARRAAPAALPGLTPAGARAGRSSAGSIRIAGFAGTRFTRRLLTGVARGRRSGRMRRRPRPQPVAAGGLLVIALCLLAPGAALGQKPPPLDAGEPSGKPPSGGSVAPAPPPLPGGPATGSGAAKPPPLPPGGGPFGRLPEAAAAAAGRRGDGGRRPPAPASWSGSAGS